MDTMDFVKRAWATLDLSSPFTPTLSVEELDKRIADLRAVEQWLALNQGMLRNTIQGLEIQRGTLAAVRNLSDSFGRISWPPGEEAAEALARFAAATVQPPPATQPPEVVQPPHSVQAPQAKAAAPSEPEPATTSSSAGPAAQTTPDADAAALPAWSNGMDPLGWWKVLQGNFEQIARLASGGPGAAVSGAQMPARGRKTAAKSESKTRSAGRTGTKPAPRRKGRQAAGGKPATAGASADAKSREER